jgi:hypothetical protein
LTATQYTSAAGAPRPRHRLRGDAGSAGIEGTTLGGGVGLLHEVGTVVGGMIMLPATPDIIASVVGLAEAAPEEL